MYVQLPLCKIMCSIHCSGTKSHLAPITDSQHKIVRENTKALFGSLVLIHIFTFQTTLHTFSYTFSPHTYIKNTQITLLKLSYQTGPKSLVKFTMCLKFVFTERQRRNKHNFWGSLLLRICKEISILLPNMWAHPLWGSAQSTQ